MLLGGIISGASGTSFTVTDLPGVTVWLDPSDSSKYSNGGMLDKSGNGNSFTSSYSGNPKPAFTETKNGLNIMTCTAGYNHMIASDGFTSPVNGTDPWEVWVVVKLVGATNGKIVSFTNVHFGPFFGSANLLKTGGTKDHFGFSGVPNFAVDDAWHIWRMKFAGGDVDTPSNYSLFIDGTEYVGSDNGNAGLGDVTPAALGTGKLGAAEDARYGDFIVITGNALNSTNAASLTDYLTTKWDL